MKAISDNNYYDKYVRDIAQILDIQYAFYLLAGDKYMQDGYVDVASLLDGETQVNRLKLLLPNKSSKYLRLEKERARYYKLFRQGGLPGIIDYWEIIAGDISYLNKNMTYSEAMYLFAWVNYLFSGKSVVSNNSFRVWKTIVLRSQFFNCRNIVNRLAVNDTILYSAEKIEVRSITKVSSYVDIIKELNEDVDAADNLFFRGHTKLNYQLFPGIMRRKSILDDYSLLINEKSMYNEILYKCASDFENCRTHLDKLTIMQHYGMPTRLLDVTSNPLVALYFACEKSEELLGEIVVLQTDRESIRWPNSDMVSILASIPALSYEDKLEISKEVKECQYGLDMPILEMIEDDRVKHFITNKSVQRLIGEIRTEKPGFEPRIVPEDFLRRIFVYASRNNPRIINQCGAFILFGGPSIEEKYIEIGKNEIPYVSINPANEYRFKFRNGKRLLLTVNKKKSLLKELESVDIVEERLFPEIERVSKPLAKKYES